LQSPERNDMSFSLIFPQVIKVVASAAFMSLVLGGVISFISGRKYKRPNETRRKNFPENKPELAGVGTKSRIRA